MVYRAALIGCGKIGSEFSENPAAREMVLTHAEAYQRCADTQLVAICDSDPKKLARCGDLWGVRRRYTDLATLLDQEAPDIISICTPNETHYALAREVLTHRPKVKAIFCEKPLAVSMAQGRELVTLAQEMDVVLSINYGRRFADNIRSLKAFLQDGELGEIQVVTGYYTKGVLHNGSHWFDLLRFLVGDANWVMAINRLRGEDFDPSLDVVLGLDNGALATLRACDARYFTLFEMDLQGTLGRAQLLDSSQRIELFHSVPNPQFLGYFMLQPTQHKFGGMGQPLLHAVEDLVDAIKSGSPPACSGQDALSAMAISLAARESAKIGQRVLISH